MIRLDWKLTLIKQINQSLDSEPSEFNGTNLTNFRSIKFVGKIDYNNQIYLYSLNEKGAQGFDGLHGNESGRRSQSRNQRIFARSIQTR